MRLPIEYMTAHTKLQSSLFISLFILNENVLAACITAAHMNQNPSQLASGSILTHREQKHTDKVWPDQPGSP